MQNNVEVELSVLTSILCFPHDARFFCSVLDPEDFSGKLRQGAFKAMCRCTEEHGQVITAILSGHFEINLAKFLKQITYSESVSTNPKAHVQELYRCRLARDMEVIGRQMAKDAGEKKNTDELYADYQQRLARLETSHTLVMSPLSEIIEKTIEQDEMTCKVVQAGGRPGIPSGLAEQDELLCGFRPTDFVITAARPGMGKTALMLSEAIHLAGMGIPVGLFSLEMGATQLAQRMISAHSGISFAVIRDGSLRGDDWIGYTEAAGKVHGLPIHITDAPSADMNKIAQTARQAIRDQGIRILYIDYLQLIRTRQDVKRWEQVSELTRRLKELAKELQIPVVALAQLNRDCEQRINKRPILADLRESGSIEQDADVVRFIYRHAQYDREMPSLIRHVTEIDVKKHRNGRTGTCKVGFWTETQRWGDIDNTTSVQYNDYIRS